MRNGQDNEMRFVLSILKSPATEYNANSLAKVLGISGVGALKISRKLEKEEIIISRKVGKANIFSINFEKEYAIQYIKFLLKREAEKASPYVKVWLSELRKIKSSRGAILFGSLLHKGKEAKDVDALIIVNKQDFTNTKKEIETINTLNEKRLHPVYQTKEDLKEHIKKRDKVILNALKGIIISGEDILLDILSK